MAILAFSLAGQRQRTTSLKHSVGASVHSTVQDASAAATSISAKWHSALALSLKQASCSFCLAQSKSLDRRTSSEAYQLHRARSSAMLTRLTQIAPLRTVPGAQYGSAGRPYATQFPYLVGEVPGGQGSHGPYSQRPSRQSACDGSGVGVAQGSLSQFFFARPPSVGPSIFLAARPCAVEGGSPVLFLKTSLSLSRVPATLESAMGVSSWIRPRRTLSGS